MVMMMMMMVMKEGGGSHKQVTSPIFEDTAPARRELGKIQNVGRCPRQAPGIQENPGI